MRSKKVTMIPAVRTEETEKPTYVVDPSKLKRFNRRDIIFERVLSDRSWNGFMRMYDEHVPQIVEDGREGYSRVDFALANASWIVHDAFKGGFSRTKIKLFRNPAATIGIDWTKTKHEVEDPKKMSAQVKRAAKLFGASLVGICRTDRNWLYADVNISRKLQNVVVMAIEMDANGIAASPAAPAASATGTGYSRMAFSLACLGEFIRNLGYKAVQCGNDTALSIPLAIDAGLGELGRNGLLITPQHGPRVRLCKIFTDLPLEADKPISFGVQEFCRKCMLCAENCKPGAISKNSEPTLEGVCRSNNSGALKWYVNGELCYQFWCENGTDCSTCIRVCPYNVQSAKKSGISLKESWKHK
jgi:epoxyqueuosine reductase